VAYNPALAMGGGNIYHVNVNAVAPGPEVGRAIVDAIAEYERFGRRR